MAPSDSSHLSNTARIVAGIAGWAGAGVLLGAVWMRTVGGIPPIWAALLLGVAVFTAVRFAQGRPFTFWRDQPQARCQRRPPSSRT